MPYKCSKCGAEITEEFAAKTTEKFGEALCESCVFDKNTGESKEEARGAPSAPDEEPEQQTHNVGDKSNDDVPVIEHPKNKKCENCGGKFETKVAAVSHDGKYQITRLECDSCSVQEWHVDERLGAPRKIDAIV